MRSGRLSKSFSSPGFTTETPGTTVGRSHPSRLRITDLAFSDLDADSPGPHRRHASHISVSSEATSAITTTSMASPRTPAPSAGPHSAGFSIPSIVNPPSGDTYRHGVPPFDSVLQRSTPFSIPIASTDESWDYSESSQSPVSDYHPRYPHRVSLSSSSSVVDLYSSVPTPLISSTMPGWEPMLLPPSALPTDMLDPDSRGFVTVGTLPMRSMHNC